MLKKQITYKNFADEEVTRDIYFHLGDEQLLELDNSYPGGIEATVNKMMVADDREGVFKVFRDLVLMSYGERSEDGEYFVQNKETSERFSYSAAYRAMMSQIAYDEDEAVGFIVGLTQDLVNRHKETAKTDEHRALVKEVESNLKMQIQNNKKS